MKFFFLFLIQLLFLLLSIQELYYASDILFLESVLILTVKFLPWICIPGYIIYKLSNTTGTLYYRFKKCLWPNDWYPVDAIYRQRYEETLGTSDISHQLVTMKSEDDEEI